MTLNYTSEENEQEAFENAFASEIQVIMANQGVPEYIKDAIILTAKIAWVNGYRNAQRVGQMNTMLSRESESEFLL